MKTFLISDLTRWSHHAGMNYTQEALTISTWPVGVKGTALCFRTIKGKDFPREHPTEQCVVICSDIIDFVAVPFFFVELELGGWKDNKTELRKRLDWPACESRSRPDMLHFEQEVPHNTHIAVGTLFSLLVFNNNLPPLVLFATAFSS